MSLATIQTSQLTLRPVREDDLAFLYAIAKDQEAMRYTYAAKSFEEFEERTRVYAGLEVTLGYAPWTAVIANEDRICGWGGLNIDPFDPGWGVEVSYYFHPDCWGRGYATELVKASVDYGFGSLGLGEIGAFAHPENGASIRVLEKCGFAMIGYEPKLKRNRYQIENAR